jgi:PTS system fructose-specific IIB component
MNVVAVTSCPTGIAHSQMAAENVETTAEARGHDIHVEVQGAMGTQNQLPADAIANADVVVITADTAVSTDRFEGLPVLKKTVKDGVNGAEAVIREAEELAEADDDADSEDANESSATEVVDTDTDDEKRAAASEQSEEETEKKKQSGGLLSGLKKRFS